MTALTFLRLQPINGSKRRVGTCCPRVYLRKAATVGRILVSNKPLTFSLLQSIAAMPKMSDSRIRPTKSFRT
uniref:Uncharacterized protein n=1 Tax=Neisseria meningitidis TaxID=487 RepID=A7IS96_NEIME|nr:hypothetical protein [Neisseria meningitidis]